MATQPAAAATAQATEGTGGMRPAGAAGPVTAS